MSSKYSKTSVSQYFKHLKTKYPYGVNKRVAISDYNYRLSNHEFKLVWPSNLRDRVQSKSASSAIRKLNS
jgi:hypothetical protein